MPHLDVEAKAKLLLQEIRSAISNGTRHYNKSGHLLVSEREIVETLLREGKVTFQPKQED